MTTRHTGSIVYFEEEGRKNLGRVLTVIRRTLSRRADLRTVIFLTGRGEGPALAYSHFRQFGPKIIAVTFPPSFSVQVGGEIRHPAIPPAIKEFFQEVGIPVLTGRLPFDPIAGADAHNREMELVRKALSVMGGSFPLCIQAVLQACDMGEISKGDRVIAASGDCAIVATATRTCDLFSSEYGVAVNEILCKPRNLTMHYKWEQARNEAELPPHQE